MIAQRTGPLIQRAGFTEKFAPELQVGNSTASGSDWDSQSVASDGSDANVPAKYVPLATPCTPWMDEGPRGAFGAAKDLRPELKKRTEARDLMAAKYDPQKIAQYKMNQAQAEREYGYAHQEYDQGYQSAVRAPVSTQRHMQQDVQPHMQPHMQAYMQQEHVQPPMQQQPYMQEQQNPHYDQQIPQEMLEHLQQQWMNSMASGVMPMPVPMPMNFNMSQQPQMQVPFGFQLVRKEKPMLEDLLPGQTRGVRRRRTVRPKRTESQIGGSSANKVFVGGLSPHSTAETLRAHFEKFGVITDCAVINEPGTRKSRGFGFVEFAGGIPAGLLDQEHIVGQRRCGVRAYEYSAQADEVTENAEEA